MFDIGDIMCEEKEKPVRITTAPLSEPRTVLNGEEQSPRMTNAMLSKPRECIKSNPKE